MAAAEFLWWRHPEQPVIGVAMAAQQAQLVSVPNGLPCSLLSLVITEFTYLPYAKCNPQRVKHKYSHKPYGNNLTPNPTLKTDGISKCCGKNGLKEEFSHHTKTCLCTEGREIQWILPGGGRKEWIFAGTLFHDTYRHPSVSRDYGNMLWIEECPLQSMK